MSYNVRLTPHSVEELSALPKKMQKRVARMIDLLAKNPSLVKPKKLKGRKNLYRVHAGTDYVVIYRISGKQILVIRIKHRSEAYRNLGALE